MITYQSKNSWGRPLLIALVGSVAVGMGVWWWQGHSDGGPTTPIAAVTAESTAPSTVASGTQNAAPAVAVATTILSDGRPSDFSPGVWSALSKAAANKPQLKPEVDKVISYMRFQRDFERWQAMEDSRDAQQRHQLARSMLEQMPDRLAKNEFSMSESLMMVTVLLSDVEPDEKKREQQIEDWSKKMNLAAPQPSDEAQILALQQNTDAMRIVPGILSESSSPDPAKVEQALLERSRISR